MNGKGKMGSMKYKNTLKDFRKYFEENYPERQWLDEVRLLYFLYDNTRSKCSHKYKKKEAEEAIRIYLDFYNSFAEIKCYSLLLTYKEISNKYGGTGEVFQVNYDKYNADCDLIKCPHIFIFYLNWFPRAFEHFYYYTDDRHVQHIDFEDFFEVFFASESDDTTALYLTTLE